MNIILLIFIMLATKFLASCANNLIIILNKVSNNEIHNKIEMYCFGFFKYNIFKIKTLVCGIY